MMKLQALTINTFYNSVLNMKESLLSQKGTQITDLLINALF